MNNAHLKYSGIKFNIRNCLDLFYSYCELVVSISHHINHVLSSYGYILYYSIPESYVLVRPI